MADDEFTPTREQVRAAAAAIANARAARRGGPAIANILEVLEASQRLRHLAAEVLEDAEAALRAAAFSRQEAAHG